MRKNSNGLQWLLCPIYQPMRVIDVEPKHFSETPWWAVGPGEDAVRQSH